MSRHAAGALALALGLAPFTPHAADDPEDGIIITATRFTERRADAPIGMRVITADDIAASTAQTLPELLGKLGGVVVRNNSGSPDQQIDLRGFGITGDQNTLVLLDGMRLNEADLSSTKLTGIPLEAIDRIEILPGAGAVQYGAGAVGGTINIITRTPGPRGVTGGAFAGYGTHDTREYRASLNAAGERAGLALWGNRYQSDNYRHNNAVTQESVLGDLRYGDGDASVGLKFGGDRQRLRLPGERTEAELATDRRGTRTPEDYSDRDGGFGMVTGKLRAGAAEWAADLGYRRVEQHAFFGPSPTFPSATTLDAATRTWTIAPRVRWEVRPFGVASQVIAGVDWSRVDWDRDTLSVSPFGSFDSRAEAVQRNSALHAQYIGQLTDRLRVNLGGRAQRVENELTSFGATQRQRRTPSAGEVAGRYALTGQWSLFARYGSSFRIATVDENGFTSSGELLEPQTARHLDGGVEYRRTGYFGRLNVYRIRLRDEIYYSPLAPNVFGGSGANINLAPTQREGIELAAGWQPTATLDLGATLNVLRAEFREGVYGGVDVTGNEVPLVPRTIGSLRATWTVLPRTRVSGQLNHVGRQRYDNDQANTYPDRMPAYTLVDLRLAHELGGWLFALNVNNVFDERYYSYGVVNTFSCITFCAYPQAGRTVFASAEYRFR